ncbi:hypothetical protein HA397_30140, partial [Escherichia coli]|nr:hypothetical protein [Escherichia coli]
FQSRKDDFLRDVDHLKAASLNNHALDLDQFAFPLKATCFVRDPRDLVVSGYFYHRRGAEPWSTKVDPTPADWEIVNGVIPAGMPAGQSYADYLSGMEPEQGLLTELEFRTAHFDAMGAWNYEDPRLHLFRYEEILGKEEETFARFADIYDLNPRWRRVILNAARQHSLANV